jgi:hypothetical protein
VRRSWFNVLAGISVNKFVKIASDFNKPNGKTVRPDEVSSFLRNYLFENFMALKSDNEKCTNSVFSPE